MREIIFNLDPFGVRSRSVRSPFGVRSGSDRVRSGSVYFDAVDVDFSVNGFQITEAKRLWSGRVDGVVILFDRHLHGVEIRRINLPTDGVFPFGGDGMCLDTWLDG